MPQATIQYQQYRNQMQDGDVLLFKGKGWLSKIIKWKTKSDYSHAGIVIWWNDRLMVLEAVGSGVLARPISYNLNKYPGTIDYFRPTQTLSDQQRRDMARYAQQQLGKSYATFRLVEFFFRLLLGMKLERAEKIEPSGQYFCSEYVADIYEANAYDIVETNSAAYTSPDLLAESDGLEYVGTLREE